VVAVVAESQVQAEQPQTAEAQVQQLEPEPLEPLTQAAVVAVVAEPQPATVVQVEKASALLEHH
jgi:hypothetical protein